MDFIHVSHQFTVCEFHFTNLFQLLEMGCSGTTFNDLKVTEVYKSLFQCKGLVSNYGEGGLQNGRGGG